MGKYWFLAQVIGHTTVKSVQSGMPPGKIVRHIRLHGPMTMFSALPYALEGRGADEERGILILKSIFSPAYGPEERAALHEG